MSDNPVDMRDGATIGARKLLARAAAVDSCAQRALAVAIDDFFLPEELRLDERMRAALNRLLRALVEAVEAEIREHGMRLLASRGETALAEALVFDAVSVLPRLARAGLLRDDALMAELIARVGLELIGAALPMAGPDDPERPSLINRFAQHPDRVVATSAMAVLIAESRRRGSPEMAQAAQADLPAELHHKLVWWVAAALRERVAGQVDQGLNPLDRALSEAAQRSLAAYDEGDRLEAAVMRLASAIDATRGELPKLLVEALGDRRIVLFTALLGHGLGTGYALARDMVLDAGGERLWLALRALDVTRDTIAQIGYALCEADRRRDLESFADMLDAIAAIDTMAAREALAPLRLDPEYRAALAVLARGEAR